VLLAIHRAVKGHRIQYAYGNSSGGGAGGDSSGLSSGKGERAIVDGAAEVESAAPAAASPALEPDGWRIPEEDPTLPMASNSGGPADSRNGTGTLPPF
jgi:hypothetical protein